MAIHPDIVKKAFAMWDAGQKLTPTIPLAAVAKTCGIKEATFRGMLNRRASYDFDRFEKVKDILGGDVRQNRTGDDSTQLNQPTKSPDSVSYVAASKKTDSHVVLAIPDMHHPFAHPDTLDFLKAVKAKYQPTKIICLGDEIDACAFSKYPKDPDGLAPGLEITRAREALIPFYLEFPEMLVCESNHTVRPWKQAFQAGLPASFLPTYSTFLHAPDGWHWAHKHEVDGVIYVHGEGRSGFTAHIQFMRGYKQSVVIGHIHSYAAVSHEGGLFAVNSGCLIDAAAYCFKYAKNMPVPVNLGCSIIHHGKRAEFIPLHTDNGGRWTGSL